MEFHVVIPVLISFAISLCIRTGCHSFSEKAENGTDRENRRCTVHLKKAGTPTMGGVIFLICHDYYFIVLCKRLSKDHSGAVPDTGIWN